MRMLNVFLFKKSDLKLFLKLMQISSNTSTHVSHLKRVDLLCPGGSIVLHVPAGK